MMNIKHLLDKVESTMQNTKAANEQHLLSMCSHGISLLAKSDVFCTKNISHNSPWQKKNVFCKKISEIFDLFSFFQASWQNLMCSAIKML